MNKGGLLVPRPLHLEIDPAPLGAAFMIVERMRGSPPNTLNFFAPPPPSEKFALSLAEQMGKLHSLSTEPLRDVLWNTLSERKDWVEDLEWLFGRWNDFNHGPSMAMNAMFVWMRKHVHALPERRDVIVQGDMMQHNMLVEDNVVTALLDWESGRIGHPGEDIGYMRPMVEKLVTWDRFMEVYMANGGLPLTQTEVDYFTFRSYIWANSTMQNARNIFESGTTDDIRLAEIGVSLTPLFLDCAANVFEKVLRKEQAPAARSS
jgi:aminoglycoside phosphotransferase (APT) family kinase protein